MQLPVLFHESYFTQFYGAQVGLYNFLQKIDPEQFTSVVVCPAEGLFTQKIRQLGIEVKIIPLPDKWLSFGGELLGLSLWERMILSKDLLPQIRDLIRLISERNICLMHCNTIRSMVTSGWAAKFTRIPLVWHVKGEGSLGYLDQIAFLLSDRIIAISDDVRASLEKHTFWESANKIVTIRDGIPLDKFNPDSCGKSVRQEFGFSQDNIVIGTVGSLSPRKRHDLFIEMANLLAMENPHLRFLIIGDIPCQEHSNYKEYLIDMAKDLLCDGRLVFAGWRDDMPQVYAAMDIFTLASAQEGLALVVLEAMAMAKPVVRTLSAGAKETVEDGVTGYLVPVNDMPAMADAVRRLVTDREQCVQMGKAARNRTCSLFSTDRMAREIETVFLDCILKGYRSGGIS